MGGSMSKYKTKGLGALRGQALKNARERFMNGGVTWSEAMRQGWEDVAKQARQRDSAPPVVELDWDRSTYSTLPPPEGYVSVGLYAVKESAVPKDAAGWAQLGLVGQRIEDMGAKELRAFAAESGGVDFGDLSSVKGKDKLKTAILNGVREYNMRRIEANPQAAVKELYSYRGSSGGHRFAELIGLTNKQLYRDAAASKDWHRRWAKVLHPDNWGGERSTESAWLFDRVNEAYAGMAGGRRGKREQFD